MEHIEMVVRGTKRIETLLAERLGAQGRGLHEKVDSVEQALDRPLVKKLRWIATVRNRVMHEDGYRLDDAAGFERACIEAAGALAEAGRSDEAAPILPGPGPGYVPERRPVFTRAGHLDTPGAGVVARRPRAARQAGGGRIAFGLLAIVVVTGVAESNGWIKHTPPRAAENSVAGVVAQAEPVAPPLASTAAGDPGASAPAPAGATRVLDVEISHTTRAQLEQLLTARGETFVASAGPLGGVAVRSTARAAGLEGLRSVVYHFSREGALVGVVLTMDKRFLEVVNYLTPKYREDRSLRVAGSDFARFKTADSTIDVDAQRGLDGMTVSYLRDDFSAALAAERARARDRAAQREASKL